MTPTRQQIVDAIAATKTKTAAIEFLKIDRAAFYKLIKKYELTEIELKGLSKDSKVTISETELRAALEKHNFNQTNAGKELGRSKSAVGTAMVHYKIDKLAIIDRVDPFNQYIPLDIPKDKIVEAIRSQLTIKDAATSLGISKDKIYEYIKLYDIPTKQSKNKSKDWDKIRTELFEHRVSVIEVCKKYDITRQNLDRQNVDVSLLDTQYNVSELKRIFGIIDFNNQGIIKTLKLLDMNVYKSIMRLTCEHVVTTDKLTERCYRIVNNYSPEQTDNCKWCGDNLLFYTFQLGYGNSSNNTCDKCTTNISGVSPASQKLFWNIYNIYGVDCCFSELNREFVIDVTENDKLQFNNSNLIHKKHYAVDFLCGNYIIEYGSDYFRKIIEEMEMRKRFLEYKGYKVLEISWAEHQKYPEETLQKCLDFLKS